MDKIRKDIELLSKILNDKNILDNRNIVNVYNQLYSYFENDFCNVLQHTDLLHKDSILNSIEDILTGMELFLIYPEIIGKTIIGLQILDATLWKNCMEGVLSSKTIDYVLGNRNIPIFIMNGQDETVIAHNNTSNKVIFDKDDYLNFNRKWFNQYKIVIKKLLHTFILKDETIDKNLVFLYLPRYMD